ncbi:MAG: DNA primase [Acidobacteriota bacterium]
MRADSGIIDQIKSSTDLVRLVSEYVRLRKAGANYVGLCPFHTEKTPSFHVHQSRQFYYCFGCGAKGDVFKFLEAIERLSFPEALRRLADRSGIPLNKAGGAIEGDDQAQEKTRLYQVNEEAARLFRRQLRHSDEGQQALNYLYGRGLNDDTIERFEIGYASGRSDWLFQRLRGNTPQDLLIKAGLVQQREDDSRCFDRFRRRVMFPIRDEAGRLVAFGGRIVGDGQPKYLNSPETPVYSKSRLLFALNLAREPIRRRDAAILVEGYMDCIALHQSGLNNVIAVCGTSLTEQQARLLSRFSSNIVVNFDPDAAGSKATLRSLEVFLDQHLAVRVLTLPAKQDPDAFIRQCGADTYSRLLKEAPSCFDYLLARAAHEYDLQTVEGKVAAVNLLLPFLDRVTNRIEKSERIKGVSQAFSVDESIIREELKKVRTTGNREQLGVDAVRLRTDLNLNEKYLLKAILEDDSVAETVLCELAQSKDYLGFQSESIFQELLGLYQEQGRISLSVLQERLTRQQDRDYLNQALFAELQPLEPAHYLEKMRQRKIEQEINLLQKQIKAAEQSRDLELLSSLHSKKVALRKSSSF